MRHYQYSLAAFLNVTSLLYTTGSTLGQKYFELEISVNRKKLTDYLATMLCSIDMQSVSIHYELQSQGRFLDSIIGETVNCVPSSITVTA